MDNPLAGAVICGGASRRMGRDKALLATAPGGAPLFRHVAERLGTVADPVILAPGTIGRLGTTGFPEVSDAAPSSGPLGGLVAAVGASPHHLIAVVAVDMPWLSPRLLTLLGELCGEYDAAVPLVDGEAGEPLHAVYARRALPALAESLRSGRLSLRAALQSLRVRWVPRDLWNAADPGVRFALNLNSPSDVEEWRSGN